MMKNTKHQLFHLLKRLKSLYKQTLSIESMVAKQCLMLPQLKI